MQGSQHKMELVMVVHVQFAQIFICPLRNSKTSAYMVVEVTGNKYK